MNAGWSASLYRRCSVFQRISVQYGKRPLSLDSQFGWGSETQHVRPPLGSCLLRTKTANAGLTMQLRLASRLAVATDKPKLTPLPRKYDARFVESRWYDWWISQGYFSPEPTVSTASGPSSGTEETFTIILPPPNITGSLHLGHALTIGIEDALVRWNRMQGRRVLWVPGLDHAGIATQAQVEKKIWSEQRKTRNEIGKEEFLRIAEKWREEKTETITGQIRRLGAAVDWSRLLFTLDEKVQYGVREAFIRLFTSKKIYRQAKLVNWCSYLNSTISDIEVDHKEISAPTTMKIPGEKNPVDVGWLSCFAFPVADSLNGEEIVVATTRLETMLGDVAVAVHPTDRRYMRFRGREVIHPLLGTRLPVIFDKAVDPELGTGALKITPAHDFKDFETASRHCLLPQRVIDDYGRMICPTLPDLHGLSRFQARRAVENLLVQKNLWRGQHPFPMSIPVCSRTGDIVEPQLKKQWFLECKEYSARAAEAVADGKLQIIPDRFDKIWQQWLSEQRDWCLSRQLWWGQQIPAYRTVFKDEEHWTAAHSMEEARRKLGLKLGADPSAITVQQDEDVLDTWFTSSALPFLAFGWPSQTLDFTRHYPLDIMETGHDILFFWVARMAFMGLALTDQLPFKKVLLHGLVCDKNGKKMSKSVGNVIDPLQIIFDLQDESAKKSKSPPIGSDALKFALCSLGTQHHLIRVATESFEDANKFCNKIWQAFHLCQEAWINFPPVGLDDGSNDRKEKDVMDIWIVECLQDCVLACDEAFRNLNLDVAARILYDFWHEKFCDVYLECTKPVFKEENSSPLRQDVSETMFAVFNVYLRLLAPFMPNISEELYQRLPTGALDSVFLAPYPAATEVFVRNPGLQDEMEIVMSIARAVRNIRAQYGLLKERVPLFVLLEQNKKYHTKGKLEYLKRPVEIISRSSQCHFVGSVNDIPAGCAEQLLNGDIRLFVYLKDVIDVAKETARLESQRKKILAQLDEQEELRAQKRFEKMPKAKRLEIVERIAGFRARLADVDEVRQKVAAMKS